MGAKEQDLARLDEPRSGPQNLGLGGLGRRGGGDSIGPQWRSPHGGRFSPSRQGLVSGLDSEGLGGEPDGDFGLGLEAWQSLFVGQALTQLRTRWKGGPTERGEDSTRAHEESRQTLT